jgi:PASTA domain-containing protein
MAWYTCIVNEVGPANSGATSNPNVLLNLTDTEGSFANNWFYAAEGTQAAMLTVGIAALTNGKHVEVGAEPPNPQNTPYSAISNLYLLSNQTATVSAPNPNADVSVPSVLELSVPAATAALQKVGLVAVFTGPNQQSSWVKTQSPVAGTQVAKGSKVTMTLSTETKP